MGKSRPHVEQPICGFRQDRELKEYLTDGFWHYLWGTDDDCCLDYDEFEGFEDENGDWDFNIKPEDFDVVVSNYFDAITSYRNYRTLRDNAEIIAQLGLAYMLKNGLNGKHQCSAQQLTAAAFREVQRRQLFFSDLKATFKDYLEGVLKEQEPPKHGAITRKKDKENVERLQGWQNVGEFENSSGIFVVSDPMYDVDVEYRGEIENIKKGTWTVSVDVFHDYGLRLCELLVTHKDFVNNKPDTLTKVFAEFEVGVDTGTVTIMDAKRYKDLSLFGVENSNYDKDKLWGALCRTATDCKLRAGIIPCGVISSTGYGDGSYQCWFWTDSNGEVVRISVNFM